MILFLDFDGVVHPAHGELFTEVDRVARWLDGWPGVDVVVSSSWREVHPQSELVEMLGPVGPRVAGCTPMLAATRQMQLERWTLLAEESGFAHRERHQEVLDWLATSWQPQRAWVALDDLPRLFDPGCENLVVCDGQVGVSRENFAQLDGHARRAGLVRRARSRGRT